MLEHQPIRNSVVLSSEKAVGKANKAHGRLTPFSCCRNSAFEEKVETAQFPRERKSSD